MYNLCQFCITDVREERGEESLEGERVLAEYIKIS